jgi:hypothetical protein
VERERGAGKAGTDDGDVGGAIALEGGEGCGVGRLAAAGPVARGDVDEAAGEEGAGVGHVEALRRDERRELRTCKISLGDHRLEELAVTRLDEVWSRLLVRSTRDVAPSFVKLLRPMHEHGPIVLIENVASYRDD